MGHEEWLDTPLLDAHCPSVSPANLYLIWRDQLDIQ
jgi:hypothetical protein